MNDVQIYVMLKEKAQNIKMHLDPADVDEAAERFKNLYQAENHYRWHDLRKDPDDLPTGEDNKQILVYDDIHDFRIIRMWAWRSYRNDDVIAWREIEPFEVEE